AGIWIYNISNIPPVRESLFHDDVLVAVTSYPRSEITAEEPIRVKSWMPTHNIKYPSPATVYAHVSQGYNTVVNASVTAFIEPPNQGSVIQLPLIDNGIGADLQAGDGIYSAYFTQFSGNGRYSLSAVVSTTNITEIIRGNNTRLCIHACTRTYK
ncbi:Epithelial chloride channel protein-like, partial [Halocaridina rubra]